MVADFRQFYGIDLPLDAEDADCTRWALLWYALPRESRTARRLSPELEWDAGEYMLNEAVYYLNLLAWRQVTKDGQKGRNAPKPRRTPGERAEAARHRDAAQAARGEINKILGISEGGA